MKHFCVNITPDVQTQSYEKFRHVEVRLLLFTLGQIRQVISHLPH